MSLSKNHDILISVVMITYKHEKFIRQAIEGVLMQKSNFTIELIIADDSSPDRTLEIINDIIHIHPNGHWIKYTRHPKNKGVMPNFIWALQQAKGEYIALCEGDDYWTDPMKLQKQVDFLENHEEYVVTYHDARLIDDTGLVLSDSCLTEDQRKDYDKRELIEIRYLITLTMVFRNFIESYPNGFEKVYNGDSFLISLLGNYGKGKFLANVKPGCYREHHRGIWSGASDIERAMNILNTPLELYKFYRNNSDEQACGHFKLKICTNIHGAIDLPISLNQRLKVILFVLRTAHIAGWRNALYYLRKLLFR